MAMDYTFFKTYEQEKQTPILVVKDTRYKAYFSYCVPRKGAADDWILTGVVRDLERLGHKAIILKSPFNECLPTYSPGLELRSDKSS